VAHHKIINSYKGTITREEETKTKRQKEWDECTKAVTTKEFFPKLKDRQKLKLDITPILTVVVMGHRKTRAYLHRLKILENSNCPCGNGEKTIEHLLNWCSILHTQRELFKCNVLKSGNWPASKHEIITKQLKSFLRFINSINFDLL
jgi:hypothetical protein